MGVGKIIGKMGIGKMGVGEMGPNHSIVIFCEVSRGRYLMSSERHGF